MILVCQPFNTDSHGQSNGAADGDVVERVEQLGEHQSIHTAVQGEGPGEYCTVLIRGTENFVLFTSDTGVVQYSVGNEDVVQTYQDYQEDIEGRNPWGGAV